LEFSVFPSILLMVTLLRLALNIASTRLILLHGNEGAAAAGEVIRAFGTFVVGGNYTVGLVVFTILVIINFVVITKGRRARRRSGSPVHLGRDARQTDEHRRRSERRPDQ
jgi:flagellar biosynthesis component FlhA